MTRQERNDRKKDAKRSLRRLDYRSHRAAFWDPAIAAVVAADCKVDLLETPHGFSVNGRPADTQAYSVFSSGYEYRERTPTVRMLRTAET